MKKIFLITVALILGLTLLIDNSFFKSSARKIASATHDSSPPNAEKDIDFSGMNAEEFAKAFKYQLITSARLIQDTQVSGVELGSFYIKGTEGQKNFVCAKYSNIELTFEAEGIAISGNIPQMIVSGPCLTNEDYKTISFLPIPYKKILSANVLQKNFVENLSDSNDKILISFVGVVEQWPYQWNLARVRLISPEFNDSLNVNGYEIISILGSPMTLNWTPQ